MDCLKELMKYKKNADEIIKINKDLQILYACLGFIAGLLLGLIIGVSI